MTQLCGEHTEAIKNLEKVQQSHETKLDCHLDKLIAIDRKVLIIMFMIVLLRLSYTPEVVETFATLYTYIQKLTI